MIINFGKRRLSHTVMIVERATQSSSRTLKYKVGVVVVVAVLGSLRNHKDDSNKNPTNLHIWQWKQYFCMLCICIFHLLIFWRRSCSFYDMKWPVLQLCGIWWQMFNFVCLCPQRWFQFNSRIVKTHFLSILTLNNWKIIAETRSYIFRWRSHSCRHRVCLSSLLS